MITIPYLQDPGHGWLEVPMSLLIELGIAGQISAYSYVSNDGATVYLEEDMDALCFHHAMLKARREYKTAERVLKGDCFIRRLRSWRTMRPLFAADAMPPIPPRVGETLNLFGD